MKYSDYYKILHRRNKYNVKFLADFLTILFPLNILDFDKDSGIFSIPRDYVARLSTDKLNILSNCVSSHSYYDVFDGDYLLFKPLFPPKCKI